MKIAFLVNKFPCLSETFILNQIIGLTDLGHHVDIYAVEPEELGRVHSDIEKYDLTERTYYRPTLPRNYFLRLLKAFGLLARYIWLSPISLLNTVNLLSYGKRAFSLRTLYAAIPFIKNRSVDYDVLHCHFGTEGLTGAALAESLGLQAKLITQFHGYDVNAYPLESGKDVYLPLFKRGDRYIAGSSFLIKQAVSLGCPQERMAKIPVGINPEEYQFQPRVLAADETIKIVTVARLVEKKGLEYSIRAVAQVAKQYPNITYSIAGDGPMRSSLESLVKTLKIDHVVKILGWKTVDEVRDLYDSSHIFMLASVTASNGDKEGQGLVLQEAQAMGLSVLATVHNGFPDSIREGVSGFLVPEKDTDALAEKLAFLIENSEKWESMGAAGRAFVEEKFDNRKLVQQLAQLYSQSLASDSLKP